MAAPTQLRIASLCAGYAGLDLGIRLAVPEAVTKLYVEREASAARILVARIEDGSLDDAPIWSDIATLEAREWRGHIDLVVAGYPCQPFSCAGKQLGKKDPRHLWPHVARIIREVQPEQVFLENVDAHLRLGFLEVARELQSMGYRLAAGLFSAEEVGAPHRRLRLFALAERKGGRCGVLRQSPGLDRFTDGRGANLAHTQDTHGRRGVAQVAQVAQVGRRGSGSNRQAVDDTTRKRYPIWSDREHQETELSPLMRTGRAIFPPGPADLEAWARLLAIHPELEPAAAQSPFRRGIDGTPPQLDKRGGSRVARLRALGNGVVPQTAALAYLTLRKALAS